MKTKTADRARDETAARRKAHEEKARANLAALTIASTFTVSGLTFVTAHPSGAALLLFAIPVWCFCIAAYATVKVLVVGEVFTLSWREEESWEANRLKLWHVELNELTNLVKTNWLSVSYRALRAAIISLFICACIFLVGPIAGILHPSTQDKKEEKRRFQPVGWQVREQLSTPTWRVATS